jgi:hypothetical protein
VTGRRIAIAEGLVLLAVAAATPAWDVTALCLFVLARLAGAAWDNDR